jgi:hypothetical protein
MHKPNFLTRISFIFSLTLLCACVTTPIPECQTHFEVTADNERINPDVFWVASGTHISLSIANQSTVDQQLYILAKIPSQPYSETDLASPILSVELIARVDDQVEFTAPQAPGEYAILYGQPGKPGAAITGILIVVQPGPWMDH